MPRARDHENNKRRKTKLRRHLHSVAQRLEHIAGARGLVDTPVVPAELEQKVAILETHHFPPLAAAETSQMCEAICE